MSDGTNSPTNLAAMFQQNQQQPVASPNQQNPITYNSDFDTSTDAYGAPIQQQQQNQQNQQQQNQQQDPNAFQQQQTNQDQNQIDANTLQQLFDPAVETISDPNDQQSQQQNQQPDLNAAFQQLADTITAANSAEKPQLDANGQPISPVAQIFNEAYGEDIDFSLMMQESGDPAEINTQMQQAVREKMQAVYANSITQSVSLAQQLVDRKLSEFQTQLKTQQQAQTAQSQMTEKLPFTNQPEYAGLSQMLLQQAMQKTNNDVNKSLQLVEGIFRLNNPTLFSKPNNTRFGAPQNQQTSGSQLLSLDNIDNFLN